MAVNLNARLKNLEQKFNPVIGKKIMIFADDADSCAVDDITVYRLPNEDADAFFDRCTEFMIVMLAAHQRLPFAFDARKICRWCN